MRTRTARRSASSGRGQRLVELARREVAAPEQEVVQRVGALGRAAQLVLHLLERRRVDEVAQLLLAEQLLEEVAVEGERLRPPLGERRVVLVHVGGDVVEEERRGERRRARRLHLDEVDPALPERAEEPRSAGQVEDVLEDTRGRSRARPGSRDSGGRPGAGPAPSGAAARAACAGPAGGAG